MKLVLLPGLDGTGELFKPFIACLPSDYDARVISYPNKLLSYEQLTEYIDKQLPKENFILIAESFSGYIAYQLALKERPNLCGIAFIASFLEPPRPYLLSLSKILPMKFLFSLPIPNIFIKRFLLGKNCSDESINTFKSTLKKVKPTVLKNRLKLISQIKVPLQPQTVQAVYIQANQDKLVPAACINAFKYLFHPLKVYKINGPHFLLQSNPKQCAKILLDFVLDSKN
jgi:pimeloyl-ACP methyl ester carboxylesterase